MIAACLEIVAASEGKEKASVNLSALAAYVALVIDHSERRFGADQVARRHDAFVREAARAWWPSRPRSPGWRLRRGDLPARPELVRFVATTVASSAGDRNG